MQTTTSPNRQKLYAQIHQAARECGLEGEGYRLALLGLTGSKTATVLTDGEIQAATLEFRKLAQEAYAQRPECSTAALEAEYGF